MARCESVSPRPLRAMRGRTAAKLRRSHPQITSNLSSRLFADYRLLSCPYPMELQKPQPPMVDVGLLVLSTRNIAKLTALLTSAKNQVKTKLYIRVQGPCFKSYLPSIYLNSSQYCPELDVRVLLGKKVPVQAKPIGDEEIFDYNPPEPKYKKVVLGGTFDRLHNGHKVLLSTAALLASQSVTCGVTDKQMIIKKHLYEMIEPVERRIAAVEEFVADVSDDVVCLAEPIEDPFGPSITVPDLEAIIVSRETVKGGDAVNKKRQERDMTHLDMEVIDLLAADDAILNECKISSSSRRREALGTLLKSPTKHPERTDHSSYIIGLTGGIASGKSNIAKYLGQEEDFEILDCDKLAHSCYDKGSELSERIGEVFPGTVNEGVVDRKALGSIVFANPERRLELNGLVWPAVMQKVQDAVAASPKKFVVVEAAAVIEAGWESYMSELWTVFVPENEAVRRITQRDALSEEDALKRVRSQVSNKTRVDASHVVFCSLWAYEETQAQVKRAIADLRSRVNTR